MLSDSRLELRCLVPRTVKCRLLVGVLAEPPSLPGAQLLEPDVAAIRFDLADETAIPIALVPIDGHDFSEGELRQVLARGLVIRLAPLGRSWPFTSEPSPNERGSSCASCSVPHFSMMFMNAFSWP